MNEDYDIDFEEKSARQATIFAIVVGLIGIILYAQEIVQRDNIRGGEWIFPVLFGCLSGVIGFLSGLTFFKSKNPTGLFPPFIAFTVHSFLFGNQPGDDYVEFMLQCFYLLLSVGITMLSFLLWGILSNWVKQGK